MAWIGALAGLAGSYLSNQSSNSAAEGMRYQPWTTSMPGVGNAQFYGGRLNIQDGNPALSRALQQGQMGSLGQFFQGQQNQLGQAYLRDATANADNSQAAGLQGLMGSGGLPQFHNLTNIQSGVPNTQSAYGVNQGLPNSFFGDQSQFQNQANQAQQLGSMGLQQAQGGYGGQNFMNAGQGFLGPYQQQNFSNLRGNMLSNFDPNKASSDYTNLLRAQAMPAEQQAASGALSKLFGSGRLGTTGGQTAYQGLMDSQNQADIGRQVAGQQFGLGQQLQAQQGIDSALNNEQGRQLGGFGANQQGMMNQYGLAQGLSQAGAGLMGSAFGNAAAGLGLGQNADAFGFNRQMGVNQAGYDRGMNANQVDFGQQMARGQMGFDQSYGLNQMDYNRQLQQNQLGFDRANSLYTSSNNATQDRFNRALQLFGGENAYNQQQLGNFQGLLGAQQSQNQQGMDLARIGASVGQSQTTANSNAAMMRNSSNQDMIAGFMNAIGGWAQNRNRTNDPNTGGGG